MAEKPSQLVLGALGRAAGEPQGLPLFAGKTSRGLFPATSSGKQAAQRCLEEGLLRPAGIEVRGRSTLELYVLTDKGLGHLLSESTPRQVLEDLVRAVEARESQLDELLTTVRLMRSNLETLHNSAEKALEHVRTGGVPPDDWKDTALSFLERRLSSGASEDCPLPELYRHTRQSVPEMSIGAFHDGLRQLHADGLLYLHPWTGPLYEIPDPPCALLVGHEIAYYASPRRAALRQTG